MQTAHIGSAMDRTHAAASRHRRGGFFCARVPQETPGSPS
jgi:hypothetical protein